MGEPKAREASDYKVYEVVERPQQTVGTEPGAESTVRGEELLKCVGVVRALSSADADKQWRQRLEAEYESGARSGTVEYRCVAARAADPIYFASARQQTVVEGGTR